MTQVQIGKLIEEAESRKGFKSDTTLIREDMDGLTVELHINRPHLCIKETLCVPHPHTAEQREEFIAKVGEKLESLSLRIR